MATTPVDLARPDRESVPETSGPALLPPPELPSRTSTPDLTRRAQHSARLAPPASKALSALASGAGLPLDAVLVGAVAEVLRAWARAPEFTLWVRDGRMLAAVVARRDGVDFASRVTALTAQLHHTRPRTTSDSGLAPSVVVDPNGTGSTRVEATLIEVILRPDAEGLLVAWDVAADAFPPGLIASASGALVGLLGLLAEGPEVWRRPRLDVVPAADRALVARSNDTAAPLADRLLQELLAEAARRDPAACAVVDGRRRLSYGELRSYAARIGRVLRAKGVGPGELVAVVMEKGWEQYAAVYGVLSAGGAYLPIDAAVPPARLARLLARGRARYVLTQSWIDQRLSWPDAVVRLAVDTGFETGDDAPLPPAQTSSDPAYVILTSGSTGEPKGVTVDHRGVVNLVTDVNRRFNVTASDRLFAVSALHFDASIYDVFGVVAAGGTVVLPDPAPRPQPDRWADRVAAEEVTFWNSVPALMEIMVGQAESRADGPLRSLRLAVLSGDWIPLTLPDRLRAQAPGIAVVSSGGPTETICWSVFYPVGDVDPTWRSIPYGTAITNQRYYIVDDELYQRPVLAAGQMAVASDIGLALGYWDDEARTRERFVTLPETGERAYLTGDLGRYLADGNIEILGREDFQVKIQGHRIELGEIEAALREHGAVEHAVVIAPPAGSAGVRRLHGFVTLCAGAEVDEEELHAVLGETLPGYMVPARITLLDALPLTGNGKINRLALAALAAGHTPVRPEGAAAARPETALERLLTATIAEVLGLEHLGHEDNFFRVGGDSLGGIRVLRRLQEITDINLPLRTLFDHPVISDLAEVLSASEQGPALVAAAERVDRLLGGTPSY